MPAAAGDTGADSDLTAAGDEVAVPAGDVAPSADTAAAGDPAAAGVCVPGEETAPAGGPFAAADPVGGIPAATGGSVAPEVAFVLSDPDSDDGSVWGVCEPDSGPGAWDCGLSEVPEGFPCRSPRDATSLETAAFPASRCRRAIP